MSEIMDLVVIEKKNAMAVFTNNDQLDPLIEAIEKEARSLVPDVTTKKGRDAIASMAHKVARSKTYIDNAGKDLVAELKALPKKIDESRRIARERLDALKDEVRRPLTEWEAEQDRIKAEEAMNALHAEALAMNEEFDRQLAARIESDHEMALLMNDAFDREQAEKKQKQNASALPAKKRLSARRKRKPNVKQQKRHSVKLTLRPPESARQFWQKSEQNVSALKLSSGPSANSEKQLNVLSVKSRLPWKQSAAKHRKKPTASAARQSNANRPGWLRRSAKQMSRRAAKPTLSTARQ